MLLKKEDGILIFGGTGFIGEYLAKVLISGYHGFINIIGRGKGHDFTVGDKVNFYNIDLKNNISRQHCVKIAKNVAVVVIMTQPNRRFTANIVKFCDAAPGLKKIIFASSLLVYPSSKKKSAESIIPEPVTDYEKEKIVEEKLLREYAKTRQINLCIARLANVYGGVKNRGIISIIFKNILTGTAFVRNGNGRQVRDFIFIHDAVKAIKSLIFSDLPNQIEIINVCSGHGFTVNQLVSIIRRQIGKNMKIERGPCIKEKASIIGSNKKIAKMLGFEPTINLLDGIRQTFKLWSTNLKEKQF